MAAQTIEALRSELAGPAIRYARDGFVVVPGLMPLDDQQPTKNRGAGVSVRHGEPPGWSGS